MSIRAADRSTAAMGWRTWCSTPRLVPGRYRGLLSTSPNEAVTISPGSPMSETTSDVAAAPEQRLDPRWIIYSGVQSLRALIVPLLIMVISGGNLLQWFGI